jgi:hypothetical protein
MEVLVGGVFCVEDMSLTGQLWSWQVSPAECGLAVVSELACQLVAHTARGTTTDLPQAA